MINPMRAVYKYLQKRYAPSDDYWYFPLTEPTASDIDVSAENSVNYSTVWACVSLISETLAGLPLAMYQKKADGSKTLLTQHPLSDLLKHAPNEETPSFNWRETATAHLELWGNHYSIIERNGTGEINGIYQVAIPGRVEVKRERDNGPIIYEWWIEENRIRKRYDEIFHVPGFGFNGLVGKSTIAAAREAIGLGLAAEKFGARYFGHGSHPDKVITKGPATIEGKKKLQEAYDNAYGGIHKSHKTLVLEGESDIKTIGMSNEDSQFLDTRRFQSYEICGFYRVPPHMISILDRATFSNVENQSIQFVQNCMMPRVRRWEAAISLRLLTQAERRAGIFAEFNVDGLLRGDFESRMKGYSSAIQNAILSPNEIRKKENLDPYDGGDDHFLQLNMQKLERMDEMLDADLENKKNPPQFGQPEQPDEETKALVSNETRSIEGRDRAQASFLPLFRDAAQRIINKEALSVKSKVGKRQDFMMWLKEFYRKHADYVKSQIGPVSRSYAEAILAEAAAEIGKVPTTFDGFEDFMRDYVELYATRHVKKSENQIKQIYDEGADAVEKRMDEWSTTRADKIALDEVTRLNGAVASQVFFAAGLRSVWRIRGAKTCPYCKTLNNRRVSRGEVFAADGETIDPEGGTGPMHIRGLKTHPPLHQGCDCYITAGL